MGALAKQMEQYKRTARARRQRELDVQKARLECAWQLAREAARLLRDVYGVQRVMVFGSLTDPDRFTLWSDVDMAAWGLTSANWLRAMAAVRSLSDDIELNLVDVERCSPELLLLDAIEREGVPL